MRADSLRVYRLLILLPLLVCHVLRLLVCVCFLVTSLQKLLDLAKKPLSVQETWETRYEQLMEQFASDMRLYIGMVRRAGGAGLLTRVRGMWGGALLSVVGFHVPQLGNSAWAKQSMHYTLLNWN